MTIRGVRDDQDDEVSPLGGHADSTLYPDDLTLQSEADLDAWREEIAARVARKRPAGLLRGRWSSRGSASRNNARRER